MDSCPTRCPTLLLLGALVVLPSCTLQDASAPTRAGAIPSEQELARWQLPKDLPQRASQLEVLALPAAVERLDWLPKNLESLILRGPGAPSLKGLPESLQLLDLWQTDVAVLPALPTHLKALDVRSTNLETLGPLPATLVQLSLRGRQVKGLEAQRCYPFLQGLLLDSPEFESEDRETDLSYLPASLLQLVLRGPVFRGLEGLPESVRRLELDGTLVGSIGAGYESVRSLRLLDNLYLKPFELPPLLEELDFSPSVDAKPFEVSGAVLESQYLDRLIVRRGGVGDFQQLPKTITHLHLPLNSRDELIGAWAQLHAPGEALASVSSLRMEIPVGRLAEVPQLPITELDLLPGPAGAASGPTIRFADSPDGTGANPLVLPSVRRLRLSALKGFEEIDGLAEAFPNLEALFVEGTGLKSLGELPPGLKLLDMRGTGLSAAPPNPGGLQVLILSPGSLDELGANYGSLRALLIADASESLVDLSGRWAPPLLAMGLTGPWSSTPRP